MPPERRPRATNRAAPYRATPLAQAQEQTGPENDLPRAENGPAEPQPLPSANPFTDGRAGEVAPDDNYIGYFDLRSHQLTGVRQFPASSPPNLVVVERATVLHAPAPFSPDPMLSVLDISFGRTVQTNFCARTEGPHGIWVAKMSGEEFLDRFFDQLFGLVPGDDPSGQVSSLIFRDGSSNVMTMGEVLIDCVDDRAWNRFSLLNS